MQVLSLDCCTSLPLSLTVSPQPWWRFMFWSLWVKSASSTLEEQRGHSPGAFQLTCVLIARLTHYDCDACINTLFLAFTKCCQNTSLRKHISVLCSTLLEIYCIFIFMINSVWNLDFSHSNNIIVR
jgi:hypothetical protein